MLWRRLGAGGQAAGYANFIALAFTILFILALSSVGVVAPLALKQVAVEGVDFSQVDAKMEKALEKRVEALMDKLRGELKADTGKAPLVVDAVGS